MSDHPLDRAISAVETLLAHRPRTDGDAFTAATQAICLYRDHLRAARRPGHARPDDAQQLEDSNVALTLLMAGRFPLDAIPWEQVESLRGHLGAMRRRDAG